MFLRTRHLRSASLLAAISCSFLVSACAGSSNSITSAVLPNAGGSYVRFANGSPSVNGPVDVSIDGAIKFSNVALNSATNYVSVNSGTHAVAIFPAGNDTGTSLVANATFSVNGSNYETLAVGGSTGPVFYAISDQVFSGSYSGFGAVNFYNISPATGASGVQFGFYYNPASNGPTPQLISLGSVIQPATESNPVAIANGIAIGFGAAPAGTTSATATLVPSAISPVNCAANTFSCDSGLVSVFLADGNKMFGIFSASGT